MENLSSETFLVHDHFGLFVSLAKRLAQTGARVIYSTPQDRYDRINEAVIGDGMGLQWTDDFWLKKKEVTCFVFPDIRHQGEQQELRDQGYPVWGSQGGMRLEQDRLFFLAKLKELGLDVPPFTKVVGLDALAEFLKDKKDIFIKTSKWRGSWETTHWRSWKEDWFLIHQWWVKWGPTGRQRVFLCFDKIDTKLEPGADSYNIDGRWPRTMLHGIERKNKAYFSAVTAFDEMPKELTDVMVAFAPYLKACGYRCQWSMENRITDEHNFFIDATTRGGLPSTPSICAAKNTGEIIRAGAEGELVEPDYGFLFSAECACEMDNCSDDWGSVVLKKEVMDHLFCQQCCMESGELWFPPTGLHSGHIGWLRTTGDTPTECFEEMNRIADELPDGVSAAVEELAHVVKEIESEQDKGIHFSDDPLPDPAIVLE